MYAYTIPVTHRQPATQAATRTRPPVADTRGARPSARSRRTVPLTREAIVAAAVSAAADGSLSTLSMRGLAEELQVSPMALYAHVSDKDDILDEILDDALARHAAPLPAAEDWREWIIEFAEQLHVVLTEHPQLLDRYCRRPVGVNAALRRMEAALAVLADAGFDDDSAVEVFATVHTVTLGFTALEVARRGAVNTARAARASTDLDPSSPRYWTAFFATLAPERFPHLARMRPDLASFTSADRFRRVLGSLLAGVSPQRPQQPASEPGRRKESP